MLLPSKELHNHSQSSLNVRVFLPSFLQILYLPLCKNTNYQSSDSFQIHTQVTSQKQSHSQKQTNNMYFTLLPTKAEECDYLWLVCLFARLYKVACWISWNIIGKNWKVEQRAHEMLKEIWVLFWKQTEMRLWPCRWMNSLRTLFNYMLLSLHYIYFVDKEKEWMCELAATSACVIWHWWWH